MIGTRPEAIKLLPVVDVLRKLPEAVSCRVVATGQHKEMLEQVFSVFGVEPDVNLQLMQEGQGLEDTFARALLAVKAELKANPADIVLVEGDTTTVLAGALAAFWNNVPVGHVEAGLRSGDPRNPFPEEMNRMLTGFLADLHFAPTSAAAENLRRCGVPPERVFISGNTVIDALRSVSGRLGAEQAELDLDPSRRLVLVTVHRRESFGAPLQRILQAVKKLVTTFPDIEVVLPVHPNPQVKGAVHSALGGTERIHLVPPLGYFDFVSLLHDSFLVLSDSGGVQEEAPSLGKPVLVLRENTERPEGISAGVARLVGTDTSTICKAASQLLTDPDKYRAMARAVNPYGDGRASERIVDAVLYRFGKKPNPPEDFSPFSSENKRTGKDGQ